MNNLGSWFLSAAVVCGTTPYVHAIATADDAVSIDAPANHGYALDWNYIYKYKNCSAVAVDPFWLLTAGHVADDAPSGDLLVNGETYTQLEVVFHPTADLALVRYDKAFPGCYPLHTGEIHNGGRGKKFAYDPLVMVGYGYPGSVTSTAFYQGGMPGDKRWGTNRGEGEGMININLGGTVGLRSTQCFYTYFDLGESTHEAGGNVYDSGGPVFIERDSTWYLTGILLYRAGTTSFTGNSMAMIHDYIDWIAGTIPGVAVSQVEATVLSEDEAVAAMEELVQELETVVGGRSKR